MDQNEFISALVAFVLGLLAKFIYDIWSERRKRKSLLITKTTLSSFTLGELDDDIRNQINVNYQHHSIKSIQIVRVHLENNGTSAIKNQAVTVRFEEQAQIIGEPKSDSSSEDLRYVEFDNSIPQLNTRRILVNLLRKSSSLSWDFVVINHGQNDFNVEHGIAKLDKDAIESDLNVTSTISSEKVSLDVVDRIRRIIVYIILIKIAGVFRDSFTFGMQEISRPVMNILIIWGWFLVIREINQSIIPIMGWVRDVFTPQKDITITSQDSTIAMSLESGVSTISNTGLDEDTLKALLTLNDTQHKKSNFLEAENTEDVSDEH